ncbi:MAG TPA: CDP-alcohol phosphatidyltransferase family protein [Candidatus Dormibacteraeota bacterium]
MEVTGAPATGLRGLLHESFALLRGSPRLRGSLFLWLGIGLVVSESFTIPLAELHDPHSVVPLGAGALASWAAVSLFLVFGAPLLLTPDGERVDRYGLPNGLTAIRAWLCFPLVVCAAVSLPGSLGLYLWCAVGGSTGMLDFVDGYVARRFGPVTALGKAMDPAMDAVFFGMGGVGSWLLGISPGWLAAGILIRYMGPFLATPFVFLAGRRPELVHTVWGRRNTAAIGLVLFVLMIVRLSDGPVNTVALVIAPLLLLPTFVLHVAALVRRTAEAPRAV